MRFLVLCYIMLTLLCAFVLSWSVLKSKHDLTFGRLLLNLLIGAIPVFGWFWALSALLFQRVCRKHRTIFDAVIVKS